jgi:hypothetical protein
LSYSAPPSIANDQLSFLKKARPWKKVEIPAQEKNTIIVKVKRTVNVTEKQNIQSA